VHIFYFSVCLFVSLSVCLFVFLSVNKLPAVLLCKLLACMSAMLVKESIVLSGAHSRVCVTNLVVRNRCSLAGVCASRSDWLGEGPRTERSAIIGWTCHSEGPRTEPSAIIGWTGTGIDEMMKRIVCHIENRNSRMIAKV